MSRVVTTPVRQEQVVQAGVRGRQGPPGPAGDAVLRQDLANPAKGAAMVAYGAGTVADKLDEIVSGAVTEPIVDAKVLAHNHDPTAHPELSAFISGEADRAEGAADSAQAAADAAFINADVYPDVASGLAAVADGEQFQVVEGDEIVRYRRDSATIAIPVARLPLIAQASRSDFMIPTRNLFGGKYYPYHISGSFPGPGVLYNTNPLARTAIVPVVAGVQYSIKVHDPLLKNRFRVGVGATADPEFNTSGAVSLTQYMLASDASVQYKFTSPITGFVFVTVSEAGEEPRLQVEEGGTYTDYVSGFTLGNRFVPESVTAAGATAQAALSLAQSYTVRTRNLFDGNYRVMGVGGVIGGSAIAANSDGTRRSAVVAVEQGKTYTIKVHEPSKADAFRVGLNQSIPEVALGQTVSIHSLVAFNDVLREYTFTAPINGFVIATVSTTGQEPLVQVEEGAAATKYVPYREIDARLIDSGIDKNASVVDAASKSQTALRRLDGNMLFPKAVNTEMTPTDPGPRFIEYFDDKMWGYNFLTGQIAYSEDEGRTWLVKTTKTFQGAVHRLLPTADGEVLAMTSNGLFKSSGWSSGVISWSSSKVQKHENATLFQFAFDGDGEKFILAEYAASVPNWPDSRYVWISIDRGETFNVVWDSLAEHGEEVNALTHLHAACYDRFADRFYFSEGHAPGGGLYCSVDDGATWVQGPGMRDGVLSSTGITPMEGDTNGPTVIVATPTGLVMGSDNRNNGMFGLIRREDPLDEEVTWTYQIDAQPTGVAMFAIRGWLDEASGTAYIAFRSERNDVPPRIFAANASEAGLVYQYPNLPVVGAQDHYGAIAKIGDDRLVAYAQFGGSPYTFRADLQYPNTEIQTMVRLELKRLGLLQ